MRSAYIQYCQKYIRIAPYSNRHSGFAAGVNQVTV